jgi:hypothetical protein
MARRLCAFFVPIVVACGGQTNATRSAASPPAPDGPSEAEIAQAQKPCGEADRLHTHDVSGATATDAFTPCSRSGARDYSGLVRIETLDEGVRILIEATDDEVTLLGPEVKERDAVIVYPKGRGTQGVEVPLVKTRTGYRGDRIVFWEDLGKLNDEGSRIDVAIFDHDKSSRSTEEMHVSLAVSTGKSCERARDENMQNVVIGRAAAAKPDLTAAQLGAPMRTSSFFARCGLQDGCSADLCVAVKKGKPVGVSVSLTPINNRVAACIDKAVRRLSFPVSENLDVVHQRF